MDARPDLVATEARGAARMARIFASLVSAELLSRALALVASLVVARVLSAGQFGAFAYALALASLVGVAVDLGLSVLVVREVSAAPERSPGLLGAVMKLQGTLAVAIFGAAAALGFAGLIGGPATGAALAVAFAVMAASTFSRDFEAVLTGRGRAHFVTLARALRGVALIAATAVAATLGAEPELFLLAWLVAELTGAAATGVACIRYGSAPRFGVPAGTVSRLLRTAIPFALLSGFGLAYVRLDVVMVGLLASDVSVGNYGVASRIVETAVVVPAFFGGAFLATVVQTGAATRRGADQTVRAVRYILLACVPLAFALAILAEPLVDAVAGSKYHAAPGLLVLLAPLVVLVASYGVLSNLQVALDHVGILVKISAAGLVLKAALNAYAIPRHGPEGAAVVAVVAELGVVAAQWQAARRHFDARQLLAWCARLAVCAAAMVAAGVAVDAALGPLAGLIAGLAVFAAGVRATDCVSGGELRSAWAAVAARAS